MPGHKLLQYRIQIYKDAKALASKVAKHPTFKHKWPSIAMRRLAKCGVYKRKLRVCMDDVEIKLYGRTRRELKDLYFSTYTTTTQERVTFFNALSRN